MPPGWDPSIRVWCDEFTVLDASETSEPDAIVLGRALFLLGVLDYLPQVERHLPCDKKRHMLVKSHQTSYFKPKNCRWTQRYSHTDNECPLYIKFWREERDVVREGRWELAEVPDYGEGRSYDYAENIYEVLNYQD